MVYPQVEETRKEIVYACINKLGLIGGRIEAEKI